MNKSIASIKKEFAAASIDQLSDLILTYESDTRAGVVSLVLKAIEKQVALVSERARLEEMKKYEYQYATCQYICGIDEVGRGPVAGPVVAAAVILPKDCEILYLNDSKKVPKKMLPVLHDEILEKAIAVGVGVVSHTRIDEINILQATYEAMREALSKLDVVPDILLNDAVTIPGVAIQQVPIIKGDANSISIAAASIVAKVTRDRMMVAYEEGFPGYDFGKHKGYETAAHAKALRELGPCAIHRKSFIKKYL